MLLNFETELDRKPAARIEPEADLATNEVPIKSELVVEAQAEVEESEVDFEVVDITERYTLYRGDSLDVLRSLPAESVHAVVTDPPYGLSKEPDMTEVLTHWLAGDDYKHRGGGFMGKTWDSFVPGPALWREVYRVLKPGGYLLAFAGSRTLGLMDTAIRLAGFEIRDGIMWLYGQGMPKNHDISKAIDKAAGKERTEVVGPKPDPYSAGGRSEGWERPWRDDPEAVKKSHMKLAPATDEAAQWEGWGTALKPAYEPIIMARKPFKGTVAENVLEHGTGGINIDATRIDSGAEEVPVFENAGRDSYGIYSDGLQGSKQVGKQSGYGRWPANVVMTHHEDCIEVGLRKVKTGTAVQRNGGDGENTVGAREDATYASEDGTETIPSWECHLDCPVGLLDGQSGITTSNVRTPTGKDDRGEPNESNMVVRRADTKERGHADKGGASRFFYTSKTSKGERDQWLKGRIPCATCGELDSDTHMTTNRKGEEVERQCRRNNHPTVKPIKLMEYLVKMVTPPGGIVLDPFLGSGTTGVAAMQCGVDFIGVELEAESATLAKARIEGVLSAAEL